jgi:hypothetical protein
MITSMSKKPSWERACCVLGGRVLLPSLLEEGARPTRRRPIEDRQADQCLAKKWGMDEETRNYWCFGMPEPWLEH